MGSEKSERFIHYLDDRTLAAQDDTLRLIADSRKDEADFQKIRANIFQVIKTIFQASARVSEEETERIRFVSSRLALFEETWKASRAKAREHDDDLKVLQEETKLKALTEIQDTFRTIWEAESQPEDAGRGKAEVTI